MGSEKRGYMSYLLRLWQIKSGGELVWRASLESPHTGERVGLASLDDLFGFLGRQIGEGSDANGVQDEGGERR